MKGTRKHAHTISDKNSKFRNDDGGLSQLLQAKLVFGVLQQHTSYNWKLPRTGLPRIYLYMRFIQYRNTSYIYIYTYKIVKRKFPSETPSYGLSQYQYPRRSLSQTAMCLKRSLIPVATCFGKALWRATETKNACWETARCKITAAQTPDSAAY